MLWVHSGWSVPCSVVFLTHTISETKITFRSHLLLKLWLLMADAVPWGQARLARPWS